MMMPRESTGRGVQCAAMAMQAVDVVDGRGEEEGRERKREHNEIRVTVTHTHSHWRA